MNAAATLLYAGGSDTGRLREHNEDCWGADAERGVFVVSDGIGGVPGGEVASRLVVEAMPGLVLDHLGDPPDIAAADAPARLGAALAELSEQVRTDQRTPETEGMGATVVAALVADSAALIGHLGDSRIYRWRAGALQRLTEDHTLAGALVELGEISAAEADQHPGRGLLTRYVGMDGDVQAEVTRVSLRPADRLLLCSDGLTGMVTEDAIEAILAADGDPRRSCDALVAAANAAGGTDNITALVLTWEDNEAWPSNHGT